MANIGSLTLRGTEDNETFRVVGDLGIGGNIYIDGREGTNKIEYDDSARTDRRNYTFENKGDAGYTMRLSRAFGADEKVLPAIDSVGISKYTLLTGSGEDHIRVEHAPISATKFTPDEYSQGIHIFANGGDDKVRVGIEHEVGGMSKIHAYVTVDGGAGANDFFAFDATGENSRHDYTIDDKAGKGYTYRLNRAIGENPTKGISPVDTANFSMYTVSASPGVDKIRVENVLADFNRGVYVLGNGGTDEFHVGSYSLNVLAGILETVYVDGGPGEDTLEFRDREANANGWRYTIGSSPGWDMRLNRWTGIDQHGVNSKDVVKYSLNTGSGGDIIRVEKASAALTQGVHIKSNTGDDEVYVGGEGSGTEPKGLDEILSMVYVDGEGGTNKLTYLDDKGTAARAYVLGLSDVANYDMRFGMVGATTATYSRLFSKYTLRGTPHNDTVQVDATYNGASEHTHIFTNDGNDTITVGSKKDGLESVTGKLFVTGGAGKDALIVDDREGVAGKFTVTDGKIEKGGLIIENADVLIRTINGAPAGNFISILGNPGGAESGLAVNSGEGGDTVEVGAAGGNNTILGTVAINGEDGNDLVKVFVDLFDPAITNLEKLELLAGVLTFNTTAGLFEDILQTGGTLTGAANVTASKLLTWSAGIMSGTGVTASSTKADLSGDPTLSRVLELSGSTLWTAHILGAGGTVSNTGVLETLGASTEGHFTNAGTILVGGDTKIGTVTVGGDFTHSAAGTIQFEFETGASDKFVVAGKVTLAGGIDLLPRAGPYDVRYTLIENGMIDSVSGAFADYAQGKLVTAFTPRKHSMNYSGGNGNDVLLDNFAPDAVNDAFTINEDAQTGFEVLGNDTDPESDALTITNVTLPGHGTAVISGSKITYTPALNYHGTDSFQYTISDGHGGTDTATVSVTITPVNDDPIAVNDTGGTMANFSTYVMVLSNDFDVDGDVLSVTGITQPASGTATISGNMVQYAPNVGFTGTDTLTYTISDGNGKFATASVTITVTGGGGGPPGGGGAGTISGMLFHDVNKNHVFDSGDVAYGTPMQVQLLDASNNVVASTTTSLGGYFFQNVAPGTYRIRIFLPAGYVFSTKDQGGNDNTDSDVDSSGYTDLFPFAGGAMMSFDAGIYID